MSTAELNKMKLELIAWINQLTDVKLISFLDTLRNSKTKEDWWEGLSDTEKAIVMKGLNDAEKGNVISSTDFWNRLKNV